MGRTRTLNSVLKSRGSKKVRDEIEAETGEVSPTYDLSPEGAAAWNRICAELDKLGVLSPAYAEIMTMTAGAAGLIEIATRDLNERGTISLTERGETKNPSVTILTSQQTQLMKGLSMLGLTPTSIGKLVGQKADEPNEFADL